MSQADQEKWDTRYRNQGDNSAAAPSELVELALTRLQADRSDLHGLAALDLACGGGRNSTRLAEAGFTVDALDVSAEGLSLGQRRAMQTGTGKNIHWIQTDLDNGLPVPGPYDLILMIRYLDLTLLAEAVKLLRPGGILVVELHMNPANQPVSGPTNPAFLMAPGALSKLTGGLESWFSEEGVMQTAPDRREALTRFVGARSLE
jgi:SAM-dependent methyltransferase